MTAATGSRQHRAGEVAADRIIHIMGTLVGVVGSAILVGIAAWSAARPVFYASVVYSFCLLMMLACWQPTTSPPTHPDEAFCANLIMP